MDIDLIRIVKKSIGYTENNNVKCKDCAHCIRDTDMEIGVWGNYCTISNLGNMPVSSEGRCDRWKHR